MFGTTEFGYSYLPPHQNLARPTMDNGHFFSGPVCVRENILLAHDTWRIRIAAPELAAAIRPGQFLMVRIPDCTDPLLGRPFALYDTVLDEHNQPTSLDIVYLIVGKMTGAMAELSAGDEVEVWGPLGNGFPDLTGFEHVALVAGGIGQTPFLAHIRALLGTRGYGGEPARRQARKVSIYYGVRSADYLAGGDDFRETGADVHLATNDGSAGYMGFVTELLEKHLENPKLQPPDHLVGCGPESMMAALAEIARKRKIPCHLSLETPMACGVGICFSCVTKVKTPDGWDYRRVCVDGPVFNAEDLA